MERNDDETFEADVKYAMNLPFSPWPFDSNWIQSHALG